MFWRLRNGNGWSTTTKILAFRYLAHVLDLGEQNKENCVYVVKAVSDNGNNSDHRTLLRRPHDLVTSIQPDRAPQLRQFNRSIQPSIQLAQKEAESQPSTSGSANANKRSRGVVVCINDDRDTYANTADAASVSDDEDDEKRFRYNQYNTVKLDDMEILKAFRVNKRLVPASPVV